ncbi:rhodoquinone biosynthesis methyltransferase RquA [Denitratisoma sp. agr-D3]
MGSVEPERQAQASPEVPAYLRATYWWAYLSPRAVRIFERQWLINLILLGNYRRLRQVALDAFGDGLAGRSLQIACVYGDLTQRWRRRHKDDASLDVADVLPVQLQNLANKLGPRSDVGLTLADSRRLGVPDGTYDRALLFFLLHEQPAEVRRATVDEALRVLKPGGRLVIVDYHRPAPWHPLRLPMQAVLAALEPYALDLWRTELKDWLPPGFTPTAMTSRCLFGGLYQVLEIVR